MIISLSIVVLTDSCCCKNFFSPRIQGIEDKKLLSVFLSEEHFSNFLKHLLNCNDVFSGLSNYSSSRNMCAVFNLESSEFMSCHETILFFKLAGFSNASTNR